MADPGMQDEAADPDQRYAICEAHFKEGPRGPAASFDLPRNPHALLLQAAGTALPVGPNRQEGGQPVRRFRKDLIRAGRFVKTAEGYSFTVTPDHLDHWALIFSRMREAGVKVPVPVSHKEWQNPENNRGWLVDAFREQDRLVGVIDLIGDDGIKLAGRSDVSIYVEPEFTDGAGNRYEWPILHVALCTDPVVPGLGEFVPVAASRGKKPLVTKRLQTLIFQGSATMPDLLTPDAAAGAVTEPKPSDSIKESFKQMVLKVLDDDALDMPGKLAKIKDILKAQEQAMGLVADKVDPAASGAVGASREPLHPEMIRLAAENRRMKLDRLVEGGRITPAVRKKLEAEFIGADQRALALSLSNGTAGLFDGMIVALAENNPVELRERTGPQVRGLANTLTAEPDAKTKDILDSMKVAAGVK